MKFFKEILTNTGPKPLFRKNFLLEKKEICQKYKVIKKTNSKNKNKII